MPIFTGDPYLLETLQPFCDQAAKERNTAVGTLRSSVENELQKLLPHGNANRQTVASVLGMSERTLSRRLADEGASYEELVDQLRRSLALQYIRCSEYIGVTNCVVAGLRRIDLVQSCFRSLDGPFTVRGP